MKNNRTDYVLLAVLAFIWSTSFLLIKVAVVEIPPFTLTAGRLAIAALIFLLYLLLKGEFIPLHPQAILMYLVAGVLANSLPFVLISWGETTVSSSLAAILMGIMPISTFVLAHIFIESEPMTLRKSAGVALGFIGLLILVGLSPFTNSQGSIFGQLAILGGAISYSVATVFVRKQPAFEGYKMAAGMNLVAAAISVVLAFIMENPTQIQPGSQEIWALIALGVFPTAVSSLLYFRVIKNLGATTFSQINYIVPVLGGIWGVVLLGETLGWNVFIALALVLSGVYLVQSRQTIKG